MLLDFKKINFEYLVIILMAVLSGILISVYSFSVLFLLASILFIIISFKYFNQVLFLLIFYLPFQVALNITSGIDLASGRVLILYLFIVWIIKSLAEKRFIIRFNLQTLLIGAFLVLALFSISQAWDMERAIRKILVFLSIFPLYFIITSLSIPSLSKERLGMAKNKKFPSLSKEGLGVVENKNNYIYKIVQALIASGFILSLIGIIQFILQFFIGVDPIIIFWSKYIAPLFYGHTFGAEVVANPSWLVNIGGLTVLRAFSLFPDPHMFSFYLGLLIPLALAIVLVNKKNINCHSELVSESNSNKSLSCFQFVRQSMMRIGKNPVKAMELKCKSFAKRFHSPKGTMEPTSQNNKFLYLALIAMFLAELLTFSRGGYLGMIAGIGAVIILLWSYINFNKKVILGLAAGTIVLFLSFTNQSIINRFLSSFDFNEGSNTERIKNWNQGYEMFADNFFTGVGIGNYSIYLYPTVEYRTPVYAHNLYLDLGAEMGVFALIAWVLLIGITMWQLYKANKKAEDDFSRALSLGLIGSLVWFSVHSFFDTPIYSPTILAIFTVVISLAANLASNKSIK